MQVCAEKYFRKLNWTSMRVQWFFVEMSQRVWKNQNRCVQKWNNICGVERIIMCGIETDTLCVRLYKWTNMWNIEVIELDR